MRTDLAANAAETLLQHEDADLRDFYGDRPRLLWVVDGAVRPEAQILIGRAGTQAPQLAAVVSLASDGAPSSLARAELALSTALKRVALDVRSSSARVTFAEPSLGPPRTGLEVLRSAAQAPSFAAHLQGLETHNPLHAELASALRTTALPSAEQARVEANLDRLKALPADLGDRFILVDIPSARLWLYEHGKPVSSMRVAVGARDDPTPLMAARLRYAVLNPYWNVPPDLVSERIAPQVLALGPRALDQLNMEVLSSWAPGATPEPPERVDWRRVAQGGVVRVRQRPGPRNMLGRAKFVMPNDLGIYLHDTPERARLSERSAYRSAGCVRLGDADHLGRWLFGAAWIPTDRQEARLALAKPVPVYIVYRTALVENGQIRFLPDPYGLDGPGPVAKTFTAAGKPHA